MKKYLFFPLLIVGLILSSLFAVATSNAREDEDKIPGQYIVVFKDSVDADATTRDLSTKHHFESLHTYSRALKGFAASVSSEEVERIKQDPRVAFVSEDRVVSIAEPSDDNRGVQRQTTDENGQRFNAEKSSSSQSVTQLAQTTPTGIKRTNAPANTTNKGDGTVVAVIDTGIQLSHPDLTANILNNGKSCIRKTSANDDNGHGTHVAGIIAATDNAIGVVGVAPKAKLIPVKVLDRNGSGTWSSVICGIDWVTANAATYNIKVANMSLGGNGLSDNNCGNTNNDALHRAICRSRDAGVTYVVAAGNSSTDASTFVPAAYDDAVITVSALADSDGQPGSLGLATSYGADDTFATFSNYGGVVDLGAPGVNILSTWIGSSYATISGTSMASPHVAGSAALYIHSHPGLTWSQVRDALKGVGETLGSGHTDPSGLHPEPIVQAGSL